jgi:hypothetical protein
MTTPAQEPAGLSLQLLAAPVSSHAVTREMKLVPLVRNDVI